MIALPPAKPPQSADDSRTEQTMPDRILIIEDEPAIADALVYALSTEGFDVHWCGLAGEGMQWLRDNPVDLLVLDVGLPDESGFEVCRRIRQFSALPIMFLTARKEEVDRIVGLEIGADDYVVKPFSPPGCAPFCVVPGPSRWPANSRRPPSCSCTTPSGGAFATTGNGWS